MAGKYWWEEYEKQGEEKSSGESENTYWWNDGSVEKAIGNDVTKRVNSWLDRNNSYLSSYNKRYESRKFTHEDAYVSDSASWLDTVKKQADDLETERQELITYINQNKRYLDPEWVKSVEEYLAGESTKHKGIIQRATQDNDYWKKFTPNEEQTAAGYTAAKLYSEWQASTQQHIDDLAFDVDAGNTQLAQLKADRESYLAQKEAERKEKLENETFWEQLGRYLAGSYDTSIPLAGASTYVSDSGTRITTPYDREIAELEERIQRANDVQQYENQYAFFDAYTKMPDFDSKSAYKSTYRGGEELNAWSGTYTDTGFDDITYDYINRNEMAMDRMLVNNIATNASFLGLDESYLKEMTDDEIKIYNYLYEPGHTDAADQYIEFLLSDLTYRQRKRQQEEWAAYAQEHPFLASGFSIMTSPLKGLSALGQVADYASDGTIDQNAGYNKFSYIPTAIRTQVASEIEKSGKWGKVGSWTYQLGMSIGDFLMTTAVSGGNSTISLALMGSGAMADTVISAKDRGLSDDQAMILGVVAGGAEIITEKFSLDALFKGGLEKGALKYILTNAFTEGTEEVSSSLINLFADIIVSKDQSQWQMQINDYIAEHPGATEGEAFRNVLTDTAISLGLDFLGGTLSGAAMGGGGATINYFTEAAPYLQKNKDAVNKYGNQTDALIQEGLESDKDSTSYYLAQKYQQQVQGKDGKNGKALTGYQIRNLLEANQEQITPKDLQKIQKAAENRLMALGQTEDVQEIAELATKRATGQKLTRAEKSDLANSQYGSRVANEMLPKNVLSGGYTSEWAEDIGTKQVNFAAYNKKAITRAIVEAMSEDPTAYKSLESRTKGETPAKVSATGKAVIRATNEEIDLSDPKIKSITKDRVVLDVNGKDVDISEIDFENEDQWNMFNALKKIEHITPAAASSMIAKLDTSKPIWEQLNGMDEAYNYGYYNYSEADLKAGLFTDKLTKEQLNDAYKLGKYTAEKSQTKKAERFKEMRTAAQAEAEKAEAEGKGKPQPKNLTISYNMGGGKVVSIEEAGITDAKRSSAVDVAKILHQMGIGTKIEFFTSEESDTLTITDKKTGKVRKARVFIDDAGVEQIAYSGVYRKSDGTIRVDLNAYNGKGLTLNVLAHELTHFIQQWSDKKYKVLADFLMKTYESTDLTMHQRVLREQKRLEDIRGEDVSYDEAYDEVVANAMSKMFNDGKLVERLTKLKEQDTRLAYKLWEGFKEILSKFLGIYKNQGALFRDADVLVEMKEAFEQLQDMFAEALVEASENYQASLTPGVDGTAFSETGEAVAHCTEDGSVQLSIHTYETEGRDVFRDYLEKCVSSKKLTKDEMTEMLDGIEEIYQTCKEFKDKYAPFSTWSDAAVVRDTHGRPVFSVVTPNGDYKMNLDFSLVCKKRRTLDAVFNEMSKRGIIDNFELGQKSVVKINEIIRKYGLETACALCFVDAKRFRQASMADSFTRLYNELVESLVPEDQKSSIGHFNFSGYETIKQVENSIDTWDNSKLDFSHINHVLKTYSNKSVEYKTAKYIKTHAEGRKLLLRGDFMSSKGFDAVKTQNPDVLKLYNSKKGTGGPKAAFGDVQYMNEVIQKARWWTPEKAFSVGGIRVQSFSDYVPRMVFYYVQMIYDLAATKLPAHAYTKEALFVKQFGLTGIKINMSLIPAIAEGGIAPGLDANGNYVWAGESFDYDTAKEIQNAEGYTENCGTICVGVSKEHILKLLRDPNIRMVIPYHKSGLNPIVAHMNKIAEFHDYTNDQRTKGKDGKALDKDFDFSKALHDMGENANPKAVADQYLKWCAAHGYTPRFAEFAMEENYYKLLEDFTLYDKDGNYVPQRAVKATFPTEGSAFGSMKSLIEAGLQEDAVIEGKRDKSLSAIVDEIQENLPKTEAEIEETQVEQADRDLEQYSSQETDADYMDAVNRKDMDTAQKMADAAAKRAGFPVKVFHGTQQFGFTKPNVKKSDDGMSFFATEDIVVAGSYSGTTVAEARKISDSNQKLARKDVPKLSNQVKDIATEFVSGYTQALGQQSWYMVAVDSITDQDLSDIKSPKDLMDYATTAINAISNVHLYTTDGQPGKHKVTISEETKQQLTKLAEEYTQKISSLIAPYSESGVYGLYANTDNFLVIDGNGSYWNKIKSDALPARTEAWTTRDVAQYAKKNGYSGVKFENLIDPANGTAHKPATVYAFFNPESQLKSADPVTYDNLGRPIPLSKRFNTKKGDFRYSSQETDADSISVNDVVTMANGKLAVNINSNASGLHGHRKGEWPALVSEMIRNTLSGKAIVAEDGDIITVTRRGAREVGFGTDSRKLRTEARATNDYSKVEQKMITAEHAASIIALSRYSSWSANTEDPTDMFKRDGLNYRTVDMFIDGDPYTATVVTALNTDPNQVEYGEKFYDIESIEKQTNSSASYGTPNVGATPHKIKMADSSSDRFTITQKQRIVNRQNATYSSGNTGTMTAMAEAFSRAKELKSEHDTDYSNRSLLANAFEGITKSSAEYKLVQEYKGHIRILNEYEEKLSKLNAEIRKVRFTKGEYDAKKLKELETQAKNVASDIARHDQKLLWLEASEPLRKLIEQERKKEALKTIDHVKEIVQNKKQRAEQTELRHKIRKAVRDLDKILNKGNKKQNVKEDMKGFVSKALELADYIFTDHISNDELIRRGITVRMTPREAALVKETEEIIAKLDANTDINKQDSSLADEEFTRLDEKRKANEDKLRDLLTAQRNERLQTPVYNLFSDLVTEYAKLKNSKQDAVKDAYDPNVERFLRSYIGESNGETDSDRVTLLQNMRVADMTTDELWKLHNAYKMVLHSVRNANALWVKGKTETIEQMAGRIMGDFANRKTPDGKAAIVIRNLANKLGWNYEKLHYALDRIGSEAFTELVMNIANSENIVMQDVQEAKAFLDEIVKEYKFNNWAVNKEIDREFLDNTGKKFKMTLGQLMSLYAYSRREGAWDHIEYGGFVFGEKALTNPRPADSYKLSKKQVEALTSLLTKEQKAYVEAMQKYLSETMGEKGNEVSMQLYGIKMFGEKNYFPIHIAGQYKAQAQESQAKAAAGFGSMSNAGFTHAQNPNAKAPFVLEGFNEIWVDHVNEMSRYHGTVPALEDMRRVMNRSSYSESGMESMAIKQLMENAFGEEAVNYFDNLYREANSGAITDKLQSKSHKLLSLFRKNSVAYSLSVLIQQPGSIVRAYALVDRKYFGFKGVGAITSGVAKAVTSKWNKAYVTAYNEMLKYAPGVTLAKEIGGFDTHTGGSIRSYLLDTDKSFGQKWQTGTALEKGKAVMDLIDDNAIANLPNVADKIAWIEIWNACKRETVAKHKDLVPNSEEFMKVVGDRFTEVIRATQVYDSMFSKSPMLKSKNLAVQYLVSFMNEPNTTANMVEKALRDVTKGDWKSGLRTAHVVIHSIIFTNLLKSLIYAMRDDDEDETYIEKYIEAVTGNMMDDFNPLNYIPLARDAWSIAQGYDVERADMAIVADALDSLDRVLKNAFTDTDEMTEEELVEFDKKVTEANWKLVESMASFFGVPVKNIRREVNGFIDHAKIASANAGKTTKMSLDDTFYDAIIDSIPFMSSKNDKQDKLYEAIISGDTKYADRIKSTYKTDDAYHAAIRKALRENDSRIKEAAQARYAGNTDEYKRIFREIQSEGNFVFDDIMSAINSELSKLTPDKETSDYTATGYVEALIMGNTVNADAMKENIISTKVANGKTQSAAEKEFATNVATGIGNAYSSGLLSKAEAEKMLAKYAGMDDEDAASRADYWAFCEKYPKYKDVFTESHVAKYYEFAESANISVEMYAKFIEGTKGLATIRDKWGDVEVTKREQVLDVIDSLPLTWKQKDALYLAYGYSENEIMNVPW